MHQLRNGFLAHYVDQMDIATIIQRHPDPIMVTNDNNEIVYTNTAGARLLCRLPENKGYMYQELNPDIHFNFIANILDLNDQMISLEVNRLQIQWQDNPACLYCLHDITSQTQYCNELEQLIYSDHLTGLYNRRGLEVLSAHVRSMAMRSKQAISAFYIDVNNLKQINDTYDHSVGDAAIIETAEVIKHSFRNADVSARVGGDEFVVLALDDAIETVDSMLARLNGELDKRNAGSDRNYTLSVSVGVGRYEANHKFNIEQLIKEADHSMYIAKKQQHEGNVRHCYFQWPLATPARQTLQQVAV